MMQTYDLDQTAQLIEAMRPTRMLVPTLLAVLCGMRRGEVAALRWRNVDLTSGQLAILESAEQVGAKVRYKMPKSGKGRTLALSASLVEELRAHRMRQAEELLRVGVRLSHATFVVAQADGTPLQPDTLTQDWFRKLADTVATSHAVSRSAARSCHSYAKLRRPSQSRQRTLGAFQDRNHPGSVFTRPARDRG
jgi:integrase